MRRHEYNTFGWFIMGFGVGTILTTVVVRGGF